MENFVFKLSKGIEVSKNGELETYHEIEFSPPNYSCFKETSKLHQAANRSIKDLISSYNLDDKKIEEIRNNEDVDKLKNSNSLDKDMSKFLEMSFLCSKEDLADVLENFISLSLKVAKFEDNVKVKKSHFEQITYQDLLSMVNTYIVNFNLASLFQER